MIKHFCVFLERPWLFLFFATTTVSLAISSCGADEAEPTAFERVFGVPGTFDAAMVEKVKSLPAGERLAVDRDGDGKNDEVWFLDNDPRHSSARRPILVRVLDEDGDIDTSGPDRDSDLYLADWQADGVVDSVIDYHDEDADGDVDQMGIFFGDSEQPWIQQPWTNKNVVNVRWSQDLGDDNQLWYDVDWSYEQNGCQYRSHFSGDEVFYQFQLENGATQWLNVHEDPFAFYDPDHDGCSEVAVRIAATGYEVGSLRYSLDIDNDAFGRHTHDYEFSITALPANNSLTINDEATHSFQIRELPVHPVLDWSDVRAFARQATWAKACLTWDEMNANTEEKVDRDPHERWEGVINRSSENFPQVGGPPCGPLNKRNEISLKPASPLRLYYDKTDRRLHLLGANHGWLDIDANLDGTVDARIVYLDTDDDGIFDHRQLDLDADGEIDFDWPMQVSDTQKFDLEFGPLREFYQASLAETLVDSQHFIDAAKSVFIDEHKHQDPAATFFVEELASWMPETQLGRRMRKTPGGARFYLDLVRDRLFLALHKEFGNTDKWRKVEAAYQAGNYRAAATNIMGLGITQSNRSSSAFQSYTRRIPLVLDNTGMPQRDDWPVTLRVAEIQKIAPDFSWDRSAVVAPQRWLEWRQVAHQVDQFKESVGREISFLADLPADSTATYYLYYAPSADHPVAFRSEVTATVEGDRSFTTWESDRGKYRGFGGQIDAIHGNDPSTLSRLALYEADQSWAVQNSAEKSNIRFSQRVLSRGPVRSAIERVASNIVPNHPRLSVRTICLIYAGHQETEIRTTISGMRGDAFLLAPGLARLPRERIFADAARGVFGSWGWQDEVVGDVGLGLIVSPQRVDEVLEEPTERRIRCRISEDGELRYWLIGDSRRARQYPIAPTVENWQSELRELADRLLNDLHVTIGSPEVLP